MLQNLTGMHALVILAVVLLLFGAAKLPALATSVGQSVRILKKEASETEPDAVPVAAPVTEATPSVHTVYTVPTAPTAEQHTS
ncbi:twin-arginine translocase TatA/TatE family subunit [Corynebacterium glyciniphilum]|uniref:twin-arginine translocase TatA/TatE family subunit n=1 Tax=Corynebacterium glyciniphilum TaxID=1404244 RepID=UPI003FCF8A70